MHLIYNAAALIRLAALTI